MTTTVHLRHVVLKERERDRDRAVIQESIFQQIIIPFFTRIIEMNYTFINFLSITNPIIILKTIPKVSK